MQEEEWKPYELSLRYQMKPQVVFDFFLDVTDLNDECRDGVDVDYFKE